MTKKERLAGKDVYIYNFVDGYWMKELHKTERYCHEDRHCTIGDTIRNLDLMVDHCATVMYEGKCGVKIFSGDHAASHYFWKKALQRIEEMKNGVVQKGSR